MFVGNKQVVQSQLKPAVKESLVSNLAKHFFKFGERDALLVFFTFHFLAYETEAMQHPEQRVYETLRPGEHQRPARTKDPECFAQHNFGLSQVFKNGKHYDVIEFPIPKWKASINICAKYRPACVIAIHSLVVDARSASDA